MGLGVARLPKANYSTVGFTVETENEDEVLIEAREGERIGLAYVIAYNGETADEDEVTLKYGDVDNDPVTIGVYEIDAGETEILIDSPKLGLPIEGDLIVESESDEVVISAWGVKA